MRLFHVQGFHIPRLTHSLSKIVFNNFWVGKEKTVLLTMNIYFALPFARSLGLLLSLKTKLRYIGFILCPFIFPSFVA